MKISKIKIKKGGQNDKGLVGFASCVIDDSLYLGNIAIFSRLENPDEFRLVFPIKEIENKISEAQEKKKISIFKPLTSKLYYFLEKAIIEEYKKHE